MQRQVETEEVLMQIVKDKGLRNIRDVEVYLLPLEDQLEISIITLDINGFDRERILISVEELRSSILPVYQILEMIVDKYIQKLIYRGREAIKYKPTPTSSHKKKVSRLKMIKQGL